MAPEITETPFLDGAEVEIGPKGQDFYVIAEDDDGDELTFTWVLSDGPVEGEDIVGREGSQVTLAWDPALDGQTLGCVVHDETHQVSIQWTLRVTEDSG